MIKKMATATLVCLCTLAVGVLILAIAQNAGYYNTRGKIEALSR